METNNKSNSMNCINQSKRKFCIPKSFFTVKAPNELNPNPLAERTIYVISNIVLCFGIILSLILMISGFVYLFDRFLGPTLGFALMGLSILLAVISLTTWAAIRVMINISLNLFAINDGLKTKK